MKKKNITIYDIAKEANVSPTTVSRVITRNPLVKESTRKHVLNIIEKFEFTPNETARSLTKRKTNMIGFVVPDITNPFFSEVYIEIEKLAVKLGYSLILRNTHSDVDMESDCLREFIERRVECIIFMGGRVNQTQPPEALVNEMNETVKRVPLILVNGSMEGVDCFKVQTDDRKGIQQIMAHLVELGHEKISLIGGLPGVIQAEEKVESFKEELERYGLDFEENWQLYTGFNVEAGQAAIQKILAAEEQPTAIIGVNDIVLYGVLKECRKQKISTKNFSFVGYDDIFASDIVHPSLTTVNHNYPLIAEAVVNYINQITNNEPTEEKVTIIDSTLIVRESTRQLDE